MIELLLGVPAKLKILTDRLTAARAAKLDNLNTTISSRAAASTALLNTVWTNAKATFLDVELTSRASQISLDALSDAQVLSIPPVQLVPATSDGTSLLRLSGVDDTKAFGRAYAPSLAANSWYTLINISGAGVLNWFSVYESGVTNKAVSVRITIDGVTVLDMQGDYTLAGNKGLVVVGVFGGAVYVAMALDFIPYRSSLKIEVKSTVSGTLNCIYRGAPR